MPEPRRKFSPQFKAEAVQMVIETGKPIAEVARDLGIILSRAVDHGFELRACVEDGGTEMPTAQTMPGNAETTARCPAAIQPCPSESRARRGDESVEVGTPQGPPPGVVSRAHAVAHRQARAGGHPTRRPTEHRIAQVKVQHIGAELRPNRGHQFPQQPGTARATRHRVDRLVVPAHRDVIGHRTTPAPVNQPAASNARRASSAVRCP